MGFGYLVVIVIGGVVEFLEVRLDNFKLILKDRKGFVKVVLCSG